MMINTDLIVNCIKIFVINMCVYYCFEKISNNTEKRLRNNIILTTINLLILSVYVLVGNNLNSFLKLILKPSFKVYMLTWLSKYQHENGLFLITFGKTDEAIVEAHDLSRKAKPDT